MPAATFDVPVHPICLAPLGPLPNQLVRVRLFLCFFLPPLFLPHLDIAVQLCRDVEAQQGAAAYEVQHKPVGTGG